MYKKIVLIFTGLIALLAYNAVRHLVFCSLTEDVVFDRRDIVVYRCVHSGDAIQWSYTVHSLCSAACS